VGPRREGEGELQAELKALIEPVVEGLGCTLWGMEHLQQGHRSLLKIYIDNEDGVDVDDCARVSRQVSALLDVEDPIKGQYTLEVSSPGMDRRLFTLEQFRAFEGADVKLSLRTPWQGRRRFAGKLCGIENDQVVVRSGDEEFLFPFEQIDRANIVPSFE